MSKVGAGAFPKCSDCGAEITSLDQARKATILGGIALVDGKALYRQSVATQTQTGIARDTAPSSSDRPASASGTAPERRSYALYMP